ncbi:hypothetical protein BBJ28_00023201, partial [Nothophytophthora sp. Chile5]
KMQDGDFAQFMSFMVVFALAIEQAREDRLIDDPFAEPLTRQIAPQLAPRLKKWTEKQPQPENYPAIRARYLDESIAHRNPSIRQIVLLRSGLDTRAYRLEALRGCHVLEVDENAELFEHKTSVLRELDAPMIPEKHEFIVADINDFNWEEKLLSSGFDSSIPTFWTLQGALMYMERASSVALLKTIDILSAPGSEIWGDMGGQALVHDGEIVALKQVNALSQAELGKQLFKLGEDDALHGVLSELPWQLELQAELVHPGNHFGREWEPILSGTSRAPVPFSFVHGTKPVAGSP